MNQNILQNKKKNANPNVATTAKGEKRPKSL